MDSKRPGRPRAHTTCTFEGCDRKHSAHGYCDAHYWQYMHGGVLRPIKPRRTGCVTEGCAGKHYALGWCVRCYEKQKRQPAAPRARRLCSLCDRPHHARGFCTMHYRVDKRARARADELVTPQPARKRQSRLPAGWDRTTKPSPPPQRVFPEIVVAPTDPGLLAACRRTLARHDALDLADMLGV